MYFFLVHVYGREYSEIRNAEESRSRRRFSRFSHWLRERVQAMADEGQAPHVSLVTLSKLPIPIVQRHNSMYAYGYHFRVDNEQGQSHISFDSGVACIATQTCRSSRADQHPIEADLQYVGVVKDIIEVDYGHIQYTVLKCSWIRPDTRGNRTIRQDEHGFWSVKFGARQFPPIEPYIMPVHAKQVHVRIIYKFTLCCFLTTI